MAQKTSNFWFGKRVLVTGGDGFAASHLITTLLEKGAYVVTTVRHQRPIHTMDLLGKKSEGPKPDFEHCDLLNHQAFRRICDRHQIDTIFHLAATAIVSEAANSPMSTVENNIVSTLNVLEVARVNNIPRIIIASTDKAYGDHAFAGDKEALPYRETYALRGLDVYSASKVGADMVAQTYAFQFGLPVIITRSCNMFGPGDVNFTRLVPRTIMSLLSGKSPVINIGNEKVLREYVYIKDYVAANLFLAEHLEEYYGKNRKNIPRSGAYTYGWPAFNIGSYTPVELKNISKCDKISNVETVIKLLQKKIKKVPSRIIEKPDNFIEIPDQYLDSSKLRKLGFTPKYNFEMGIDETIAWYKKNEKVLAKNAARYIQG